MNSASIHANNRNDNGIYEFWSHASPILMTSLSSHLSLKSCSFCILEKEYSSDFDFSVNFLQSDSQNFVSKKTGNRAECENYSFREKKKKILDGENFLKNISELSVSEFMTPKRNSQKIGEKLNLQKNT